MGNIKIPYYSVRKGRGFWLSTKPMQAKGFPSSIPCGPDGPDAWKIAQEWNARWQAARTGREPAQKHVWPRGSLGEAFDRFRRTESWKTDKAHRTREDWERGWNHIAPIFGDLAPRTVTLARRRVVSCAQGHEVGTGSTPGDEDLACSLAGRRSDALLLCRPGPELRHTAGDTEGSVGDVGGGRGCQAREGSLAAKIPRPRMHHRDRLRPATRTDRRTLPASRGQSGQWTTLWFEIDRAKTGRDALATLSQRTQALMRGYVATLPSNLLPTAALFMTRTGAAYTKNSLAKDFRNIRRLLFPCDTRQLQDMRRTGAVEAQSGGADLSVISQKMANTISS
jgi:hypothetical protein